MFASILFRDGHDTTDVAHEWSHGHVLPLHMPHQGPVLAVERTLAQRALCRGPVDMRSEVILHCTPVQAQFRTQAAPEWLWPRARQHMGG